MGNVHVGVPLPRSIAVVLLGMEEAHLCATEIGVALHREVCVKPRVCRSWFFVRTQASEEGRCQWVCSPLDESRQRSSVNLDTCTRLCCNQHKRF